VLVETLETDGGRWRAGFPPGADWGTLLLMRTRRLLRLLFVLFLPVSLGLAGSGPRWVRSDVTPIPFAAAGPRIGPPTQTLPSPVHDEATCAFCQAAIFPPCKPTAVRVPEAALGMVREDHVSPDARVPHTNALRLTESRAPPKLRIV
jgi:hypothetical protein